MVKIYSNIEKHTIKLIKRTFLRERKATFSVTK